MINRHPAAKAAVTDMACRRRAWRPPPPRPPPVPLPPPPPPHRGSLESGTKRHLRRAHRRHAVPSAADANREGAPGRRGGARTAAGTTAEAPAGHPERKRRLTSADWVAPAAGDAGRRAGRAPPPQTSSARRRWMRTMASVWVVVASVDHRSAAIWRQRWRWATTGVPGRHHGSGTPRRSGARDSCHLLCRTPQRRPSDWLWQFLFRPIACNRP